MAAAGQEPTYTIVAALVDTNILVYRYDPRFPEKQRIATKLLRQGIATDSIRLPHQAIIEFVAVVTRPLISSRPLLKPSEARREAEEFLAEFTILYPNDRYRALGASRNSCLWTKLV